MAENKPITPGGIKMWWPFLLALITIVSMWVTMGLQIQQQKVDLARFENDSITRDERITDALDDHTADQHKTDSERDTQYLQISVTLAQIQKDILYIRTQLDSHATE